MVLLNLRGLDGNLFKTTAFSSNEMTVKQKELIELRATDL